MVCVVVVMLFSAPYYQAQAGNVIEIVTVAVFGGLIGLVIFDALSCDLNVLFGCNSGSNGQNGSNRVSVSMSQDKDPTTSNGTIGQTFHITWKSTKTTSCVLKETNPVGTTFKPFGNIAVNGTHADNPAQIGTYKYDISCKGTDGSTVTTNLQHKVIWRPTATLAQDTDTTSPGQGFTVSWTSSHATSCTLKRTNPAGATTQPFGPIAVNGSHADAPSLLGTDTYALSCTGTGGTVIRTLSHNITNALDLCTDIPGVQTPIPPPGCNNPPVPSPVGSCIPANYSWNGSQCVQGPGNPGPNICTTCNQTTSISDGAFFAKPASVHPGETTILSWTIKNPPSSCTISGTDGFGTTISGATGSIKSDPITEKTQFTLDCGSVQAQTTVDLIPSYQEI